MTEEMQGISMLNGCGNGFSPSHHRNSLFQRQKYKKHTCSVRNADAAFSPQLSGFRSVFCRKQRWFLKWQIRNTTACSSFCSHEKVFFFSGLSDISFSQNIFFFQHTQLFSGNTCCYTHLLSPPAFSFFSYSKQEK